MQNQQGNQQPVELLNQLFQHANVGASSRLGTALSKGLKPPLFEGKNVSDWVFKIDQYFETIDPNANDQDKISFAANLMQGKALTWWKHKKLHQQAHYETFDDMTRDIYNHFVDVDLVNKLRDCLDNLVQGKGSVQNYITRFKELQIQLGLDALTEQQAIYKFKKGLQPNIRVVVHLSTHNTFDELCQTAAQAE